jgi:hypothetical protein
MVLEICFDRENAVNYDPRIKLLLTLYFREFVELFLARFAERIDWEYGVEFLDKELQSILPDRPKGTVDLLAKLRSLQPLRGGLDHLCLMHTEVEGRKSRRVMGRRMCRYFHRIDETLGLPTVPVAMYIKVGGEGLGWQSYDMTCWGHAFNHFEFPYIGLPALDGRSYVELPNPLAWALTGLMNVPAGERARVKAESLRRAAHVHLDTRRRAVLVECVESFTVLDEYQRQAFEELLASKEYQRAKAMQKTIYDEARELGMAEGLSQGERKTECKWLVMLLQRKFGTVPVSARKKIERLTSDEREQVAQDLLGATSLKELGL